MLADRLDAAAALYGDRRVDRILASGDHSRLDYDEVNAMRLELVRRGVPDGDVVTGHAGFDTNLREVLARVKAVEDIVTGAKPRCPGPKVAVTGTAEASRG